MTVKLALLSRNRSLSTCAGAMDGIRLLLVLSVALYTCSFAQGVTPLVLWHGMGKGHLCSNPQKVLPATTKNAKFL